MRRRTRDGGGRTSTAASGSERSTANRTRNRGDRDRPSGDAAHPERSGTSSGESLRRLQRGHGNRAIQRLVTERIQPKLKVGDEGDRYEREADTLAAALHARRPTAGAGSRADSTSGRPIESAPRPEAASRHPPHAVESPAAAGSPRVDRAVDRTVSTPANWPSPAGLQTGGRPLPGATRDFYEERFGVDLGGVRVHTGRDATRRSDAIDAHAFTYRDHVWLGAGTPLRPSFTLAHELAHVVQQTRPGPAARATARAEPIVRRLPFWVPKRGRRPTSGTRLHGEILGRADGQNGVETEVGVPNADRNDWGLGLDGRADLYRAQPARRVGIYFEGPTGEKRGNARYLNPKPLPSRGRRPRPYLRGEEIRGIAGAPTRIGVGDLKPADASVLQDGERQLANYERGFADARELTNQWAAAHDRSDRWPSLSVDRLPQDAVGLPDYTPGSRGQNRDLLVADVELGPGGRPRVRSLLDPAEPPINQRVRGDLWVEYVSRGLWGYYAVPLPADRDAALGALGRGGATARREALQAGYVQFASRVATNIDTLRQGLEEVRRLPARRPTRQAPPADRTGEPDDERSRPVALRRDDRDPPVRRRRASKLRDPFDRSAYRRWREERKDLRRTLRRGSGPGRGGAMPSETALERLRLLGLVYEAEAALSPPAQRQNLPSERQLRVEIESERRGTSDPRRGGSRTRRVALPDLYAWTERWTSRPANVLGLFRYRFGRAFVVIAGRLERLKARLRGRMRRSFRQRSHSGSRRGWVGIALQALGVAIRDVGELLLSETMHLVVGSVRAGIEQKVDSIFDIDEGPAGETVDRFRELADRIRAYRQEIGRTFSDVVDAFGKQLDWIDDVRELAERLGPVIEAGLAIVQCATPPGWGCLKLLLQKASQEVIRRLLKTCYVRRKTADLVLAVDAIRSLPEQLAGLILATLQDAAPASVGDVFDEPIPQVTLPDASEISCDDVSSGPSEEEVQALLDLRARIGAERLAALIELAESRGVAEDTPLTVAGAHALASAIEVNQVSAADLRALAADTADADTRQRLDALRDLLDRAAAGESVDDEPGVTPLPTDPGAESDVEAEEETGVDGETTTDVEGEGAATDAAEGDGPGTGGRRPLEATAQTRELVDERLGTRRGFQLTVVSGVDLTDYKGHVVQITARTVVGDRTLTLRNLEVRVKNRYYRPSEENPERMEVHLKVTRKQSFDFREEVDPPVEVMWLNAGGVLEHDIPLRR